MICQNCRSSYKQDLRDYYPYGLFAEPLKNIVRTRASSGTTGKRMSCRLYKTRPRNVGGLYGAPARRRRHNR